jgi:Ca2+-binding EF-hand superfamily protein
LNGTYDIDYDDGEKEMGVEKSLVRVLATSSSSRFDRDSRSSLDRDHRRDDRDRDPRDRDSFDRELDRSRDRDRGKEPDEIAVGSVVEAQYGGRSRWYRGVIARVRVNGTYDIDYDDGEKEVRVDKALVRLVAPSGGRSDEGKGGSDRDRARPKRDSYELEDGARRSATLSRSHDYDSEFRQGDRAATYWYRPSKFGAARHCAEPCACVVMRYNSDNTYTVELEKDGSIVDDVPATELRPWALANQDLDPRKTGRLARAAQVEEDKWAAVVQLAEARVRRGDTRHRVPTLAEVDADLRNVDSRTRGLRKLECICGDDTISDFRAAFEREDEYRDGDLDLAAAQSAFRRLGGEASELELRAWAADHGSGGRPLKHLDFVQFMLAFASLFHPAKSASSAEVKHLARSLQLSGEWKDLGAFARSFGARQLKEIERIFDAVAAQDASGTPRVLARDILEAFHRLGRSVTVTRLQEWMVDSDVRPMDALSLADFVSVFCFFFGPSSAQRSEMAATGATSSSGVRLSLAEVAVQVMTGERWTGSKEQTVSLVQRLCAGRGEALTTLVCAVRDAFEALDDAQVGEVYLQNAGQVLSKAGVAPARAETALKTFREKMDRQGRVAFFLPEVFEAFGAVLEESQRGGSVSIAEAFAMLRLYLSHTEVHAAADLAVRVVDNILGHPKDPKYWQINTGAAEFKAKVWQHESGRALMKAIGFSDEPSAGVVKSSGQTKQIIQLAKLPNNAHQLKGGLPGQLLNDLESRRSELEQETQAMEGAPSVGAAVRELRAKNSLTDVRCAVETALTFVQNILKNPSDLKMYRVKRGNPAFHHNVGRLQGGLTLMRTIGFVGTRGNLPGEEAGPVLVLRALGGGFDASASVEAGGGGTGKLGSFKFPALDGETEKFLWRRKADLEVALRALEAAPTSDSANTLKDAAHVLGSSEGALARRSVDLHAKLDPDGLGGGAHKDKGRNRSPRRGGKGSPDRKHKTKSSALRGPPPLSGFLKGASAAQIAQIQMIKAVFERMDADKDSLLSVSDVKAYFRAMGRNASDLAVRKWIRARDIDQDGAVGLPEFVASFAAQLDPSSKSTDTMIKGYLAEHVTMSPVTTAFGAVRVGAAPHEATVCMDAVHEYVQRVLDSPATQQFWRVGVDDKTFRDRVGRLFGGIKLMEAMGFVGEANGQVLALRDPSGAAWAAVPTDVRKVLQVRLDELNSHRFVVSEPSISNVAAVSHAIGLLGSGSIAAANDWHTAVETILLVVRNIIAHPNDSRYYGLNTLNPGFHRRVGRLQGAVQMLVALGFREQEGELVLSVDTDVEELKARALELEVGLKLLQERKEELARQTSKVGGKGGKTAAAAATPAGAKGSKVGAGAVGKDSAPGPASPASSPRRRDGDKTLRTRTSTDLQVDATAGDKSPSKASGSKGEGGAAAEVPGVQFNGSPRRDVKAEHDAREEKKRRLATEAALEQQRSLVKTLQVQVSVLEERQEKALTLRESLALNRVPAKEVAALKYV